ncbi:MAG TPA: ribokinase [Burkholderiales bacterium]|nr:ribokinase [Burkholderiales bacterium]
MKPRIVVVGSVNMDLVARVPRMPLPGETLTGSDFRSIAGGKGANQAVAAARLGADVSLIGRIGTDGFGARLRNLLEKDHIALPHLYSCDGIATGAAIIMVDSAGENCIVLTPGANAALTKDDIDQAASSIEQADVLICQLETPLPTVRRAMQIAKVHGTRVVLNPAPAQSLPASDLALVDYLIPNETEAGLLTGITVVDLASAKAAAARLREQGPKAVLLTLGPKGVLIADENGARHIPAPQVTAVDTTAAGDTFIGGFTVALAEGLSLVEAAQFGQRAAAISVTRFGAQTSIPNRDEVMQAA